MFLRFRLLEIVVEIDVESISTLLERSSAEYLSELQQNFKWIHPTRNLKISNLALIKNKLVSAIQEKLEIII